MKENNNKDLIQKRQQLQIQIRINELNGHLADWWLPTIQLLNQEKCKWSLEYLVCATGDEHGFWGKVLFQPPWNQFHFTGEVIRNEKYHYVHEKIYKSFPGNHPVRYVPNLSVYKSEKVNNNQSILENIIKILGIVDQPVYLLFARMAPVIVMQLSDIVKLANTELLLSSEDICITSVSYEWLIFRSIEDEWRHGFYIVE